MQIASGTELDHDNLDAGAGASFLSSLTVGGKKAVLKKTYVTQTCLIDLFVVRCNIYI